MSGRRPLALAAALTLVACGLPGTAPPPSAAPSAAPAADPRVTRARELLKQAESEPLPTPPPPPSPRPRNWAPDPAPAFKPAEVEAIRLLEEAAAADPKRPEAHDILARLLDPHAARRHQEVQAAGKKKPPPAPPDQGIDASPARVTRAYRAAIEATPGAAPPQIEPMIAFATRVGDLDSADWAYQERIRRARENLSAGPLLAYADFLMEVRKDPLAAAEQYRNVLLWRPDDAGVKARLAGIYLELARGHLEKREYAAADSRVKEAARYVGPGSPHEATLADYRSRLSAIRR